MPVRSGPPPPDADVAVVGAGPVGMTLAGRLAQHGLRVLLLERSPEHARVGSRAICMQRETLEIWQRLGIGERVAARGVQWFVGRTYFGDREIFNVRLPGSGSDHFPPFVNISQSEVEEMLLDRLAELDGVELLGGRTVTGIVQDADGVTVRSRGTDGEATHRVRYLVGTDGAHSSVRALLGSGFPGHSHGDLFLICDVHARLPFPNERRLFFNPPWNPGRQTLVHPQPDDVWRIDWQVAGDTDAEAERASGRLDRRIRDVIGTDTPYELVWMTAYRFHQRVVDRFRVGRVFLAGDAAHLMSPFGARGLNSGAADAENLAWKLALVARGEAGEALLESYHVERRAAALENLAITDGTMRFMVPRGPLRRVARNVILAGSRRSATLRGLVNSGRLSQPHVYRDASGVMAPHGDPSLPEHGAVAPDAAIHVTGQALRLRDLIGEGFILLLACGGDARLAVEVGIRASRLAWPVACRVVVAGADHALRETLVVADPDGELATSYARRGPRAWLIRPDGHVAGSVAIAAREDVDALPSLLARAIGAQAAPSRVAVERRDGRGPRRRRVAARG